MQSTVIVIALLCAVAMALPSLPHGDAPRRNGVPIIPCATEEHYHAQLGVDRAADCSTQGQCDDVAVRDATDTNKVILISTAVHLMRSLTGQNPDGVGTAQLESFMDRMNKTYGDYGIYFNVTYHYHNDNNYYCIPPYSSTNSDWSIAIDDMKKEYAYNVPDTLNIFISCQTPSLQGTLFGIATFPWTLNALRDVGGLWLNSISVDEAAQLSGDVTAEHEAGHCFGLWHTFHGSDEVIACDLPCEELPHNSIDPAANEIGDFCADTPATPRNYECSNPTGDACNGSPWGSTDYTNFMGYGMDPTPCGDHFSDQQKSRMHCWICDALSSWAISGC